jgi:hypothetical protein
MLSRFTTGKQLIVAHAPVQLSFCCLYTLTQLIQPPILLGDSSRHAHVQESAAVLSVVRRKRYIVQLHHAIAWRSVG